MSGSAFAEAVHQELPLHIGGFVGVILELTISVAFPPGTATAQQPDRDNREFALLSFDERVQT